METGQLNIKYIFGTVYFFECHFGTLLVGFAQCRADMLDERTFESTVEDGIFIVDEYLGAFSDEDADDGGSEVCYLFIFISYQFTNVFDTLFFLLVEEKQIQIFGFPRSQKL